MISYYWLALRRATASYAQEDRRSAIFMQFCREVFTKSASTTSTGRRTTIRLVVFGWNMFLPSCQFPVPTYSVSTISFNRTKKIAFSCLFFSELVIIAFIDDDSPSDHSSILHTYPWRVKDRLVSTAESPVIHQQHLNTHHEKAAL